MLAIALACARLPATRVVATISGTPRINTPIDLLSLLMYTVDRISSFIRFRAYSELAYTRGDPCGRPLELTRNRHNNVQI